MKELRTPCNGVVAVILQPVSGDVQIIPIQAAILEVVGDCKCKFHNCAVADSDESLPDKDCSDVELPKHPAVKINKVTVDGSQSGDGLTILAGEAISWKYTVTNTGNITLHDIVVRDSEFSADIGVIAQLAPGASETLEKVGTAINGSYTNGASAQFRRVPRRERPLVVQRVSPRASRSTRSPSMAPRRVTP